MTSKELAKELGIKETYLINQWKKNVERYGKIGITLVKIGRGENAKYGIKSYGDYEIRY